MRAPDLVTETVSMRYTFDAEDGELHDWIDTILARCWVDMDIRGLVVRAAGHRVRTGSVAGDLL